MKELHICQHHITLILLLAFAALTAKADPVVIGDLRYELNSQNNTAAVVAYDMFDKSNPLPSMTSITVPATVGYDGVSYTVTEIGEYVFSNLKKLEAISLPSTISTIGKGAFCASGITEIEIPEKVTVIADNTFAQCLNLETIKFPSRITKIGELALFACGFKSLEIPEGVTSVGGTAFSSCPYLESLSLPSTLKSILLGQLGDPFGELHSLRTLIVKSVTPPVASTSMTISNGTLPAESCVLFVPAGSETLYRESLYWQHLKYITAIGSETPIVVETIDGLKYALHKASQTAALLPNGRQTNTLGSELPPNPNENYVSGTVSIPSVVDYNGESYNVTSLAPYAFETCTTVDQVIVPDGVIEIGNSAFESSSVESVSLPTSLREIGEKAFAYCENITSLTIPGAEKIGKDAFDGCRNLESITFNDGTVEIGDLHVGNSPKLKALRLPGTLKKLGLIRTYSNTAIEEIVLPASLQEIEQLDNNNSICKVYSLNTTPPVLIYSSKFSTLYVPESAVETYKNDPKWKSAREILPIINDLTVSAAGGGSVAVNGILLSSSQSSFDGEDFGIQFFPDEGLRVASVSLNDKDITDEISALRLNLTGLMMQNKLSVSFDVKPEATICIKGADSHSTVHTYAEGTDAKIEIIPEEGWRIYSLTYNNEDVTANLIDNIFTTGPLHGDNLLNVVMEKENQSHFDDIAFAQRHIYVLSKGNQAEVVNLDDDEMISIYDASGKCIYQGTDHSIELRHNEIYILRTSRETLKFAF